MACVPPPANVPPTLDLLILHQKRDEKPFLPGNLTSLERIGVVAPTLVAYEGPDVFGHRALPKCAVLDRPFAASQSPTIGSTREITFKERFTTTGHFKVLE